MAVYRPHADFGAPFGPSDSTAEMNAMFDQIRSDGYGTVELDGEFRCNARGSKINNMILRGQGWTVGANGGCRLTPYDPNYFILELTGTTCTVEGGFGFDNPYGTTAKGGLLIAQLAGFNVPGSGVNQASTLNKMRNTGASGAWSLASLYTAGVGDMYIATSQWWNTHAGAPGVIVHANGNIFNYVPKYDALMVGGVGVPPIRHNDVEAHDNCGAATASGCCILAAGISHLTARGSILDSSNTSQGQIVALSVGAVPVGWIDIDDTVLYSENNLPSGYNVYIVPGSTLQHMTVGKNVTNTRTISAYLGTPLIVDGAGVLA